jgi:type II secretory pathway component PulM
MAIENDSRLEQWINAAKQNINDSQAFQQLKAKWEELDPQSRKYLKIASIAGIILILLFSILSVIWGVHRIKADYAERKELLQEISQATQEIRQLKETYPSLNQKPEDPEKQTPWPTYFETIANQAGIDKSRVSISTEKPGTSSELSKELFYDIVVKHINVKQLVHYAVSLESGSRPVKLRNLSVETESDSSGFLNATLALSAFNLVIK